MAEVLAKKEELADRLEKANEEAIASAIAEEEQLTREIEAEENNDINIETDNDSDFSVRLFNITIQNLYLEIKLSGPERLGVHLVLFKISYLKIMFGNHNYYSQDDLDLYNKQ